MSRWLPLLLCLMALDALADQASWKDYVIHYTTLPSTLIPADVAAAHDIVRADDRIIINITVRRNEAAVAARVTRHVTNLLNQLVAIDFREITEPGAVYYLGSHRVDERETLRFDLDIRPDGEEDSFNLKFLRKFY
ncbi:MAG: DUF4426 domain-containing protein [Pseudomonadales bacterium]|nr:DUF4426 domain-containing protein [Pseudomonadales bacterium]